MQAFRVVCVVLTCGMRFNNAAIVCRCIVHIKFGVRVVQIVAFVDLWVCFSFFLGDAINPKNNETYSVVSLHIFRRCFSPLQLDFGFTYVYGVQGIFPNF